MLDKAEPPSVPDGYGLSVGFYCLIEIVKTIQLIVEGNPGTPSQQTGNQQGDDTGIGFWDKFTIEICLDKKEA